MKAEQPLSHQQAKRTERAGQVVQVTTGYPIPEPATRNPKTPTSANELCLILQGENTSHRHSSVRMPKGCIGLSPNHVIEIDMERHEVTATKGAREASTGTSLSKGTSGIRVTRAPIQPVLFLPSPMSGKWASR